MTTNISKWPIFSVIGEELINRIRLAIVFGSDGTEAIFITKDDEAFGLGTNKTGCLGLDDDQTTDYIQPKKIEALSGIGIKSLAYGHDNSGTHVVALTESGRVFSWGCNSHCQLGNESFNNQDLPAEVSSLTLHNVVQVACGSCHTLVLTSDGEVFAWGGNSDGQIGSGSNTIQPTPAKVISAGKSQRVVAVACGQLWSAAVLNSGDVYAWGLNRNGELGNTRTNNLNYLPTQVVSLAGVNIRQVACGRSHMLALTADGSVFAWGQNNCGQLGTGNTAKQSTPVRVEFCDKQIRIVEVAASQYNHLSAAVSDDGRCWVWGQCRHQSVLSPLLIPIGSVHDVFVGYGQPAVTCKPIVVSPPKSPRINRMHLRLAAAFDDPKTADLKFVIEGQTIHVHKSVLKIQCQHFRTMFKNAADCGEWSEFENDEIELDGYSYPVYHAFLKYLYTDQVDLPPDQAIDLLDLANSYLEGDLKKICDEIIRRDISVDNVSIVYAAAIKFEAKELEDLCFNFIIEHLTSVVQSEAFGHLNDSDAKKLFVKAAGRGVFKT